MKKEIKRICVYCASSVKINKIYFEATEKLAKIIVKNNIEVVFGGGSVGLMGKLADTIIQEKGKIIGIMPKFMQEVEWAHKGVTEFHYTDTLYERKKLLLENIDALVTLAGGSGTLDELLDAITLKRLGQFTKPIIILNTNEFYNPLKQMLEKFIQEGFMSKRHEEIWTFVNEPDQVMNAIYDAPQWDRNAIHFATVK
jgi:uncharacterized protein (TIGR00730 family)